MKRHLSMIFFMAVLVLGSARGAYAQIIVKIRPAAPVIVRPVAPSARHIWIENEWAERGGRYEAVPGYWAEPRRGFVWVPGHWKAHRRRGGWVWVPGHWRRI